MNSGTGSTGSLDSLAVTRPPVVTVGLPVYNGANYLREAIDSVLGQTLADLELIISDNCSTDVTASICLEYAGKDSRVRYHRNEKNVGGPNNFNLLVGLARGKYFKWLAHDDKILPEFLESSVRILEERPEVVLAYSRARCIDEKGQVLHSYEGAMNGECWPDRPAGRFRRLISEVATNHSITVPVYVFGVMRTDALRRTRLLRPYISADNNLVAELLLLGQFYEVPSYLSLIRYHPGSSGWIPSWSARRLQEYFRPDGADLRDQVLSLGWRQYFEYYRLALEARLSISEKLTLAGDNTIGILRRLGARARLLGRRFAGERVVGPWQRY